MENKIFTVDSSVEHEGEFAKFISADGEIVIISDASPAWYSFLALKPGDTFRCDVYSKAGIVYFADSAAYDLTTVVIHAKQFKRVM